MKRLVPASTLVLGLLALIPGCKKSSPPPTHVQGNAGAARQDQLKPALDLMRQGTDVSNYRDALHLLNTQLSKDAASRTEPLSPQDRENLRKRCGLSDDEMGEVEALVFRPQDAFHLFGCFLFRDARNAIEVADLPPLEQARLCFEWVIRHVQLHEQADESLPPAFVVQRGFGGGRDRALVLLALLRQFQMEGCLLTPPGLPKDALEPLLVGVLVTQNEKSAIHLFDPRLGLPVAGPEGKAIATLNEVRTHPELLKPSAVAPDLVPKLEVVQVSPLESLSPRMRYLQDLLAFQDKVSLFQNAAEVNAALARAAGRDVIVWNETPTAKGAPSPLRALRDFLSPENGGTDKTHRYERFMQQRIPHAVLIQKLQEMRLFQPADVPEQARDGLLLHAEQLFRLFYVQPEDFFLHGQFEAALTRLDRIRRVLETEEDAKPLSDAAFQKMLSDWRAAAREAYVAQLVRKSPDGPAKVNALWTEDQFLLNLFQVDSEIPVQKYQKKVLSLLLLSAGRDALAQHSSYLMASCLHEKAAQLQANQDQLAAAGKDVTLIKENARFAWENTRREWNHFLERYQVGARDKYNPRDLPRRLAEIERRWSRGELKAVIDLLEQIQQEMHATCAARLRLAEAQQHLRSGPPPALKELVKDLEGLQQSSLPKILDDCREKARHPLDRQRLELLARTWAPQGYLYWLHAAAQIQLAAWRK